ncbi:hypothetical protein OBBRIDRAFT_787114 [Obba rivulosa]|uniref:Phospholipid/glycerol acyltransferase domain-containing protein n=1 Tax=Obba rivulosa TaxID=1052685 RepID=A0A8E2DVT1_9APHY|nr:hypothetical protein OBBRIDRAFT_787114 [Obba rivulosa]
MRADAELYAIPIASRPRRTWYQVVHAITAIVIYLTGCLMINISQFVVILPLRLLPFQWATQAYYECIRYSKGAFGTLIVLVTQWFAPTTLVISFEKHGPGRFTEEELNHLVERDGNGRVATIHLPQKAVLIANHQVYADWWYAWCLSYYMQTFKDIHIVLKRSLKWVPVLGWGMQFFNFTFLARSWASDKLHLASSLSWLASRAEKEDTPLTFILYPEGTVVSKNTRPISKKYADKLGIPDTVHTLLPRSTGLHYSLRSLAPRMPSLQMIDITMAYPGIPPFGYGQDYYTMRSIFLDGVAPPFVHMHIRRFDIAREVPIGNLSSSRSDNLPNGSSNHAVEVDIPSAERDGFELWLRDRWREKDVLMARYLETGSFADAQELVKIPLEIRQKREILNLFCFFLPALFGWAYSRFR